MDAEDIISVKIGQGLVKMGEMTEDQVQEILTLQEKGDQRLFGEIAVDTGYIDLLSVIRYMESSGME
ncbi:MAG: hypothetical protein JW760_15375 [Spirochaetales bacterium]|nr:hypothetical protein [Spirochaetales bacterium]